MESEDQMPVMPAERAAQQAAGKLGQEAILKSGQDLGIGDVLSEQKRQRLLNRDGTFNVLRNRKSYRDELNYATFLQMSWVHFFLSITALFIAINVFFGAGYVLCGRTALGLNGPDPGVNHFWQAFFFSVHTFATIGYGNIVPVGMKANLLVTVESFFGLAGYSLVTGLLFARFAKPIARIRFSNKAAMRTNEKPALLIRLTNASRSELIQMEATAVAAFFDPQNGTIREYFPLTLERSHISFLPLAWTLAHFVTPDSPFHTLTEEQFQAANGEVIVQVSGRDQASSQVVYARISYTAEEIAWNSRYVDMYRQDKKTGLLSIDMDKFDSTEPLN
jgi:inward rectifier potassium channel